MRKRLSAFLICVMLFSLVGCGSTRREEPCISPFSPVSDPPFAAEAMEAVTTEAPLAVLSIPEPRSDELVRVRDYAPSIFVDLRYAGDDNFTGYAIYAFRDAWLRYGTLQKLCTAQESLNAQGYGLLIWDAFRPQEAQYRLWEFCPDPVYVANPYAGHSSHSNGGTVDITLVTPDGQPVEMPSGFDEFSALADRDYGDVSSAAAEHARILERAMTEAGFVPYAGEWWHYADADAYPYEDLEAIRLPAEGQLFCPAGERELTLRTAPDPHAAALAQIPSGTSLTILGYAKGFARVEYLGQQGYVPLDELQNTEP